MTMAALAGKDVIISPSEQVDQVWHLHMTYTDNYRQFTTDFLEKPFKHSPSAGGTSEGNKFKEIYGETLKFYREIFT